MSSTRGTVIKASILRAIPLVLILGLGWQFVISPRMSEPESIAAQTQTVNEQISVMEQQAAQPEVAQARYGAAVEASNQLALRYPSDVNAAGLTDAVVRAAEEAGITVQDMVPVQPSDPVIGGQPVNADAAADPNTEAETAPTAPATGVKYATATLTVTMKGTPNQIDAFLARLPRQERGLFVSSVTVAPIAAIEGEAAPANGQVEATVQCVSLLMAQIPNPAAAQAQTQPAN